MYTTLTKLPAKIFLHNIFFLYSKLLNKFGGTERNEVKVFDAAEQCAVPNLLAVCLETCCNSLQM